MITRGSSLAAALALLSAMPSIARAGPADDVQDVIFFHDARPLFLRIHIEVDGKPYRTHWAETVTRLHKGLDADGDGVLSVKERAPWLPRFGAGEDPGMNAGARPQARSVDGVSTAADLAAYLRPSFGPFQLRAVPGIGAGPEILFSRLDLDGDKTLSASDLGSAGSTLLKLDQDDDETLRAQELLPYQSPFTARRTATSSGGQNQAPPPPFVAIGPGEPLARLARRLLAQYDKEGGPDDGPGKDNKLQPVEIGLDPDAFAAVDQDGDGGLDSEELVRALASLPPGLEVRVRMNRQKSTGTSSVEVVPTGGGSGKALAGSVRKGVGGDVLVALESQLIEISNPAGEGFDVREFYRGQFRQSDADNNKYLDAQETRNGTFGNNLLPLMDRDGDGKVFLEEMDAFVGGQVEAAESRTVLSVSDQGRSLFQVLDLNRDGRLSARELREAAGKLPSWDRNGDGLVAADEIPRHYRLDFGPGVSPLLIQFRGRGRTAPQNADPSSPRPGPVWFQRMDLNLDGDVSPREFLGTADQFRRIDADSDGLVDHAEASRAR